MRNLQLFLWILLLACHRPNPKRPVNEYIKDLAFSHKKHEAHDKAPQKCSECHKRDTPKFSLPSMTSCARCHNDPEIVPAARLLGNCSLCHETLQKSEAPKFPWHYGKQGHQVYSKQPVVYCAYCHDKNPAVYPIKERYEPRESCVGCHDSEGKALPGGPL